MNPTERFSSRVENYVKYRPSYPPEAIELLKAECGLKPGAKVADIGSGTGILTQLLIDEGAEVYAVEPNKEMREAAERLLRNFHSIDATAEDTSLPDGSMDLVVAAQAFHWFDRSKTRKEFHRILKREGYAAIIWNDRHTNSTPFLRKYEELLHQYGTDYAQVVHRNIERPMLDDFFHPNRCEYAEFPNVQTFGWEGFLGRVLSSSYVPADNQELIDRLRQIYEEYNSNGFVSFDYTTQVFYGTLTIP